MKLYAAFERLTLQTLVEKFFKQELNMATPSLSGSSTLFYESGEDLEEAENERYEANAKKTLAALGLKDRDEVSAEVKELLER